MRSWGNRRSLPTMRGNAAASLAASGPNQMVRSPALESSSRALAPSSDNALISSHSRLSTSERRAGKAQQ